MLKVDKLKVKSPKIVNGQKINRNPLTVIYEIQKYENPNLKEKKLGLAYY